MNDFESVTITIKGINEVNYKNSMKILYPNNKYVKEYTKTKIEQNLQYYFRIDCV